MSTVAVASVKGAPGATTTVLAMAAVWPSGEPLLVAELDPDGGVLAARRALGFEPGLVSLAAALRGATANARDHTQPLTDTVRALVAPSIAEQVRVSVATAGDALWPALRAACDGNVIVDCGRLSPASAVIGVARETDVTLIVARPRLEDVALARDRIPLLRRVGVDPTIVLIDDGPYRTREVAEALGAPVAARLPVDRRAADALNGLGAHHRLAGSRLLRNVRGLRDDLGIGGRAADASTRGRATRAATGSPRGHNADTTPTSTAGARMAAP